MTKTCLAPNCTNTVGRRLNGRQRHYCSTGCRQRAFRGRVRNETPGVQLPRVASQNAPDASAAKIAHFVTSEINDLATPKIGGFGISGPGVVIRSEVIDAHRWTEAISSDGVTGFVTHVDLRDVEPSPALSWIEVNEATYKLTDGTMERTPASHGQWGGFNIERGIAWVFDTSLPPHNKPAWCAACGVRKYGPTANLEKAKQAAMDFALAVVPPG